MCWKCRLTLWIVEDLVGGGGSLGFHFWAVGGENNRKNGQFWWFFGIYDTIAGMTKKEIAIASVVLGVFGFLFHISASLSDLNQRVGMNTSAITANTVAMGELRTDIREIRGLLTNHIAGHNHASVITDSAEGLE